MAGVCRCDDRASPGADVRADHFHADLLADITNNDRKVKGELADKVKAALDEFAASFA